VGEGDRRREMTLEECWFQKGLAILKFQGVDSISDADLLAGDMVWIPRSQRRELPPGAVYISDLIGCRVMEDGVSVGEVNGFLETGGVPVLQLQAPEGEILIPYAEHICREIDLANREIHVKLPEGLQEVNKTTGTGGRRRQRNARRNRNARCGGNDRTTATGSAELKEHNDD
jgi:16S rRNA processing protein RimM